MENRKALGIRLDEKIIKKIKIIAIKENRTVSNLVGTWILHRIERGDGDNGN